MGRGPAPLEGDLLLLNQLVAERDDATLAECADLLAARAGKPQRSAPPLSFQRALGSPEPHMGLLVSRRHLVSFSA
jgi:hypothetical protein